MQRTKYERLHEREKHIKTRKRKMKQIGVAYRIDEDGHYAKNGMHKNKFRFHHPDKRGKLIEKVEEK